MVNRMLSAFIIFLFTLAIVMPIGPGQLFILNNRRLDESDGRKGWKGL